MSTSLGNAVPPAQRSRSVGWRDPRLWIGVAIVAASVLIGVRVMSSLDDSVQVWAVQDDVAPGQQLAPENLVATSVRFSDASQLDLYFLSGDELPADLTVQRPLGAGELLPRDAVGPVEGEGTVQIALAVDPAALPAGVVAGSVVQVYVTSTDSGNERNRDEEPAGPVLQDVTVISVPASADSFGGGGQQQVVVAVPEAEAGAFVELMAQSSAVITIGLNP